MALRDKVKFNSKGIKPRIPHTGKFKYGTELLRKTNMSAKEHFQKGVPFVSGESFPLAGGILHSEVDGNYYYASKEK